MAKRGRQRGGGRGSQIKSGTTAPAPTPAPAAPVPKPETAPEPAAEAAKPPEAEPTPPVSADELAASKSAPRRGGDGLTGLYLHLHPRSVRRRSTKALATLGLGLSAAVALALTTLSGLLLMIHYVPSVERAHASVQDLIALVPMGRFFRNLHRWAGHAAVLFAFLHLLRTFLWGAYRATHRRVWLLGTLLLLTTIATSYSGYLLPWDQDAYWTVTVGTSLMSYVPLVGDALKQVLLGGDSVGQSALTRFYVLHVALLPTLGLLALGLHLFRLRRAGGLARPPGATGPGEELMPASPNLSRRELGLALSVAILLCLLALGIQARLGPLPDMLRPDDPPKAPWFLVGVQEMVSYSATVGGVLFPGLLVLLLALLPWLDGGKDNDGAPLPSAAARRALPLTALAGGAGAASAVAWWGDPQASQLTALNPASIAGLVVIATALLTLLLWRRRALVVQALLVGLLAALLVFTGVGWFWRGPDWKLVWHPGPGRLVREDDAPWQNARSSVETSAIPVQLRSPSGALDRCPTCHRAMLAAPGRRSAHPTVKGHADPGGLGCSICHGGQGRRLDTEAHQPGLGGGPEPFLRRPHLEARCARCHLPGIEGAPRLAQGIREYLDAGCSGCHQPGRFDQGLGPDLRQLGRRSEAELLGSILEPERAHASATMWSLRSRFDERSKEGKRALASLLTALLAMSESPRPFQSSWARPQARSDVPCGGCHLSTAKSSATKRSHRCNLLRSNESLRCPSCHDGGERARLASSARECPQIAAARPTCQVCHGGREAGTDGAQDAQGLP